MFEQQQRQNDRAAQQEGPRVVNAGGGEVPRRVTQHVNETGAQKHAGRNRLATRGKRAVRIEPAPRQHGHAGPERDGHDDDGHENKEEIGVHRAGSKARQ